ncbi:MAG: hypothetical protein VX766_12035 [Pseudomonadota bacterium]|nr:hypothetical protein [Pseudomonadota bacterium]
MHRIEHFAEGVLPAAEQAVHVERILLDRALQFRGTGAQVPGTKAACDTTLFGSEYRYDFTRRWDLGLHGSVLSSWSPSVHDVQAGLSIGHTPFDNFWISLGYNFVGFTDDDFTAADFTAQGPFVKFRFKLNQESLAEYLGEMPFTLD